MNAKVVEFRGVDVEVVTPFYDALPNDLYQSKFLPHWRERLTQMKQSLLDTFKQDCIDTNLEVIAKAMASESAPHFKKLDVSVGPDGWHVMFTFHFKDILDAQWFVNQLIRTPGIEVHKNEPHPHPHHKEEP